MKKFLTVLFLCLLVVSVNAQWKFDKAFPDTATSQTFNAIHGCVVDHAGKVWVQNYYTFTHDTILVGTVPPVYKAVRSIKVYNANGTEASFSPVRYLTFPDLSKDTLSGTVIANAWSENTGRGLGLDKDGNVLATYFDRVYKINATTGAGMLKIYTNSGASLTRATASTTTGDMFVANVAPGNPIRRYSNTGSFLGNVVDTSRGYSRGFEVTADGNTVWWAGYDNQLIMRYQRSNVLSPYTFKDSILKGMTAESQWRDPKDGNIWVCAGPADNPPAAPYTPHTWYKVNISTLALMDSVTMKGDTTANWAVAKHRAATFTTNGDTCYVTCWPVNTPLGVPYIERFVKTASGITNENNNVVSTYTLSQNYPNPFNPTTEIKFSVPKEGFVTLKVYNVLGAEVATVLSQNLHSGSYTASFDASKLSSGMYVYQLSSAGYSISKKMMLLK